MTSNAIFTCNNYRLGTELRSSTAKWNSCKYYYYLLGIVWAAPGTCYATTTRNISRPQSIGYEGNRIRELVMYERGSKQLHSTKKIGWDNLVDWICVEKRGLFRGKEGEANGNQRKKEEVLSSFFWFNEENKGQKVMKEDYPRWNHGTKSLRWKICFITDLFYSRFSSSYEKSWIKAFSP